MALLGSTIDPRLFVQDYSGFTRAADIQAEGMANLGSQIAGGIKKYGEAKAERKKLEAGTKAAVTGIESAIKMGESLGIDVKSSLTPYLDKINDPNVSPIEAAAYAQQASNAITNVLSFGMKANELGVEKERYKQATASKIAELQAEANKPTKLKSEKAIVGGLEVSTLMDDFGNYYDPSTKLKIIDLQGYAKGLPAERVLEQGGAFVAPAMPMGSTQAVDTGMVLPDRQGNVPTLSKEAQAAIDIASAGYIDGTPTVGLPIEQDQSQAVQAGLDITPSATQDDSKLTPRGTPIEKEKKAETQMTAAQVQGLAAQGFRVNARPLADGSFMVSGTDIGGQAGETFELSPEGGLKITRGGGAKAEAAKEAKVEAVRQKAASTNQMFDMAAQTLNEIPNLPDSPIGAKVGEWFGKIVPGTPSGQVVEKLGSINANIAFNVMQDMRDKSPTGAAAGNMTEKEWPLFWQQYGNLSAATNKDDLRNRLQNMTIKMFNASNGSPEEREKAIKEGKITKEQNAKTQEAYLQLRNRMKIPESGIEGFSNTGLSTKSKDSTLFAPDVQSVIDKYTQPSK
jgi:hypothetical protein